MSRIQIHYLRPPDREEVFRQELVHDDGDVLVSVARDLTFEPPVRIEGRTALETGSEVVWFTFPGAWHDIGRFHTADGAFRGFYANIITPPRIDGPVWHTTDLFLDLWLPPDLSRVTVLDEDEFEDAVSRGWIDPETEGRARAEVERLIEAFREGSWPPSVVHEWTLERTRQPHVQGHEGALSSPVA